MVLCCVVVVHGQQSPLPPPLLSRTLCASAGFIVFSSKLKHIMCIPYAHSKQNTQKFSLISSRFNCCFFIYLLFLFKRSVCSRSILLYFFHILFALNVYFVKKNVTQQLLSINERKTKKDIQSSLYLNRLKVMPKHLNDFTGFFPFSSSSHFFC